jgi:hypothetical protein
MSYPSTPPETDSQVFRKACTGIFFDRSAIMQVRQVIAPDGISGAPPLRDDDLDIRILGASSLDDPFETIGERARLLRMVEAECPVGLEAGWFDEEDIDHLKIDS